MKEPALAGDILDLVEFMSPLPGLKQLMLRLTHSWRCGLLIFRQLRWLTRIKIMSEQSVAQHYLVDALQTFRDQKKLAERAFAQVSDEDFFAELDAESNSIAVNVKHMAGNMLSRWTDF